VLAQVERQTGGDDPALTIDQRLAGHEDFIHIGRPLVRRMDGIDRREGVGAKSKESAKNSSAGKWQSVKEILPGGGDHRR
jgi:hypothetical protein